MLQDKENTPQGGKKLRKLRRDGETTGNSKFYQSSQLSQASNITSSQESLGRATTNITRFIDQNFSSSDVILGNATTDKDYLLGHVSRVSESVVDESRVMGPPQRLHNDPPPPLPPKPKHLPPTATASSTSSSWTSDPASSSRSADKTKPRVRRAVYLDQPSSSFV